MADFDMSQMNFRECYNLITGAVVPRPIALITTLNEDETVNAAPFAWFNAVGASPPMVAFAAGLYSIEPERPKDTRVNALRTGEFVVNMVSEALSDVLGIAAADFPPGESEIDYMNVDLVPSTQIKSPRIRQSPVNLECRVVKDITLGLNNIIFGEVVHMHIEDELIDVEKMYIKPDKVHFVARMPGGGGVYTRTRDIFSTPRISYAALRSGQTVADIKTGTSPQAEVIPQSISDAYDRRLTELKEAPNV